MRAGRQVRQGQDTKGKSRLGKGQQAQIVKVKSHRKQEEEHRLLGTMPMLVPVSSHVRQKQPRVLTC